MKAYGGVHSFHSKDKVINDLVLLIKRNQQDVRLISLCMKLPNDSKQ